MKVLSIIAALLVSVPAAASESSAPVVEYVFGFANVQSLMRKAASEQLHSEPELREFVARAVEAFDVGALIRQEEQLINRLVPPAEAQQCLAFVATPLANKFAATVRKHESLQAAAPEIDAFAETEKRTVLGFMTSPCLRKVLAALQSPEFQEAARENGAALACAQLAVESPEKLKTLRALGHCRAGAE